MAETTLSPGTLSWVEKIKRQRAAQATAPKPATTTTPVPNSATATIPQMSLGSKKPATAITTPTSPTQQDAYSFIWAPKEKPFTFTPEQIQTMKWSYNSKQDLYNDVLKNAKEKWMDWSSILNALNVAFEWVDFPSRVETPWIWKEPGDNALDYDATNKYFDEALKWAKDPEWFAQIVWLKNDYSSFFERNTDIEWQVNKWFPWLYDAIQKAWELWLEVWDEFLNKLDADREMFLQRNQDLKKRVADTYAGSAKILNNVYWQEMARSASSAAATWMWWAASAASRARTNAEVFKLQNDLAKEELEQYKALDSTVDEYMRRYLQTFWQSRDKYVIDNFNNLLNIKSSLLMNTKNLEMQEREMASRAAENAALANAIWWQASGWTPSSWQAWGWVPVDWTPSIPSVKTSPWGQLVDTPLRENVEPWNPSLFDRLPDATKKQLITTYWSEQWALQALNKQKIPNTEWISSPTFFDLASGLISKQRDESKNTMTQDLQNKLNQWQVELQNLYKQISSQKPWTIQYNYIAWKINELKKRLDIYNQGIINRIS